MKRVSLVRNKTSGLLLIYPLYGKVHEELSLVEFQFGNRRTLQSLWTVAWSVGLYDWLFTATLHTYNTHTQIYRFVFFWIYLTMKLFLSLSVAYSRWRSYFWFTFQSFGLDSEFCSSRRNFNHIQCVLCRPSICQSVYLFSSIPSSINDPHSKY